MSYSEVDLGGGGSRADASPPQVFDPLPTQRVLPLYYFEIFILVTDSTIFLKAPEKALELGEKFMNLNLLFKFKKF